MSPCLRIAFAALIASAGMALAEEATLVLRPGESLLRSFPSAVSAYDAPACLTVRPMGPSVLRLTAGDAAGTGTLSLVFPGGATERIRVEVLDDAALYVRALRERLRDRKGVSVREKDGVVFGTVASRAEWEALQAAVVEVAEYFGRAPANAARVRVTDEPARVRKELEGLGYAVRERVGQESPLNELAVEERNGRVVVSGKTYSQEALDGILAALRRVGHLAVGAEPGPGEIACQVDVSVDRRLPIRLRVAVTTLSEGDILRLGQNVATLTGEISATWGASHRATTSRGASFDAPMSLSLFGAETTGEETSLTDSIVFVNHGEPSTLEVGGTLLVNTGENSDDGGGLESVEYGLTMTVSGGLVAPDKVVCDLDISRTGDPEGQGSSAYTLGGKVAFKNKAYPMALGKTYVLSHNRDAKVSSSSSGVPILRSIPIVKWLFSASDETERKYHVLLLVSPVVEEEGAIAMPTSGNTAGVVDRVLEKTGAGE